MASQPVTAPAPSRARAWLPIITGAIVLAVALLAMASWLLREPKLMPIAGYRMVFNTALCFALAAIALFFNSSRQRAGIQTAIGAVIVLLAGLVLAQYFAGRALGIDFARLHDWFDDLNPYPGRMAPATSVAFLLTGACFIALHRAPAHIAPYLARGLAAAVVAIGLSALIGLLLGLNVMFDAYWFREVALPTAACFTLTAAGLWASTPRPSRTGISGADRILYTGAAVLVAFGLVLGIAGLVALKNYAEKALGDSLLQTAQSQATLFATIVQDGVSDVETFAGRPSIVAQARALRRRPGDADALDAMRQSVENELARNYSAIELGDANGRPLVGAGRLLRDESALLFPLKPLPGARIYWSNGYVLHAEAEIRDASGRLGWIVAQRPLTTLTAQAFGAQALGDTGEVAICEADDRLLQCAPQRLRRAAYDMPRRVGSASLAMDRALDGRSGTLVTTDYRRRQVIAAHTPIGDLGLGMVLKMDTAELYEPLRRQLTYIALLMLAMLGAGLFALHRAVKPLASSLQASELRLSLALHASRRALWDWDLKSGRVYLSKQWQALLGGESQPLETTIAALRAQVHPDDGPRLDLHLRDVLSGKVPLYDIDHRVRARDGSWLWIRSRGEVIERDASGRALRMTGTNSDITTRVEMQKRLAHQATHDMLTGLPNRSLFYDRLAQAIARSRRGGSLMGVMYLDIDKFKSINDTLGHDAGDDLLAAFSRRLADCVRATDTVARLGGDEYAVILETLSAREDGERIAEKIVTAMRPEFTLGSRRLAITTSVGLAFYDGRDEIGPDALIKRADEALYAAKGAGRNNYQVYEGKEEGGRVKAEGKAP